MQLTRDLFAIAKFLLSYATDKQTDKQTDSKILPMPTDIVGMGNKIVQHFNIVVAAVAYYCFPQ